MQNPTEARWLMFCPSCGHRHVVRTGKGLSCDGRSGIPVAEAVARSAADCLPPQRCEACACEAYETNYDVTIPDWTGGNPMTFRRVEATTPDEAQAKVVAWYNRRVGDHYCARLPAGTTVRRSA